MRLWHAPPTFPATHAVHHPCSSFPSQAGRDRSVRVLRRQAHAATDSVLVDGCATTCQLLAVAAEATWQAAELTGTRVNLPLSSIADGYEQAHDGPGKHPPCSSNPARGRHTSTAGREAQRTGARDAWWWSPYFAGIPSKRARKMFGAFSSGTEVFVCARERECVCVCVRACVISQGAGVLAAA